MPRPNDADVLRRQSSAGYAVVLFHMGKKADSLCMWTWDDVCEWFHAFDKAPPFTIKQGECVELPGVKAWIRKES